MDIVERQHRGSPRGRPGKSSPAQAGGWIDPRTLMRIKNLQMRAKVVVEGFFSGLHRSPYHGFSVEFSEYRQYSPGDDPRYLDWKLYARSDRYYIKRFEDETNLRCFLLVDLSNSMGYGSGPYTKADYAKTVAATLAYFLALQRDAVGLLTFADSISEFLPARFRPGHMHRLMMGLERSLSGRFTNLEPPIEQIARTVSKRGLIVLISDLLAPIEKLEKHLGYLRLRGHEVILLRVLDPAELDLGIQVPSIVEDLETGRDIYVDPAAARLKYVERFNEHARAIARGCANLGIELFQFTTDRPLEMSLFDFLGARQRRGKQVARRSGSGRRFVSAGGKA